MTEKDKVTQAFQMALDELVNGRYPQETILQDIPPRTEARTIIDELTDALQRDGMQGVKKAFIVLCKEKTWLRELKGQALPQSDTSTEEKPARRIQFRPSSYYKNLPPRQWLIKGMIPQGGCAMMFGPSGAYKSFLAMDWGFCIALGLDWLGHTTTKGRVAYIAGEGAYGIGQRVTAWEKHNQQAIKDEMLWYDGALALQEPSVIAEVVTAIEEDFGATPPVFIVVDTLSRCSGGVDENSNSEMARLLASCDVLQQKFGCTVLIVHHTGKDDQRGPRGASALVGNMETIFQIIPTDDGCKVSMFKQKDAPKGATIALDTLQVRIGDNPEDTSLVLVQSLRSDAPVAMKPSEQTMYGILIGKELAYKDWVQLGINAKLSESSAKKAISSLLDAKRVKKTDPNAIYRCTGNQAESEDEND